MEVQFRLCLDQEFGEKNEIKMDKLDNPIVQEYGIIYLFHLYFHFIFIFIFPHQIQDPNTALTFFLLVLKQLVSCLYYNARTLDY